MNVYIKVLIYLLKNSVLISFDLSDSLLLMPILSFSVLISRIFNFINIDLVIGILYKK